ncbi:hypothetical protein ACFJYA_09025 [Enterococcus faecalis]
MKKLIIYVIGIVILVSLSVYLKPLVANEQETVTKEEEYYNQKLNKLKYINYMNISNEIKNSKDILILFGKETDNNFLDMVKALDKNKIDITTFGYFNTNQNINSNKQETKKVLLSYRVTDKPTIIHYREGKEINRFTIDENDKSYNHLFKYIEENSNRK